MYVHELFFNDVKEINFLYIVGFPVHILYIILSSQFPLVIEISKPGLPAFLLCILEWDSKADNSEFVLEMGKQRILG